MSRPTEDFVATLGPAFLAHLLRRLSDRLVDANAAWHAEIGLVSPPRTSSTLLALAERGPLTIAQLARLLRQSHQLVQQWIRALAAEGLVESAPDPADARRANIALTSRGVEHVALLRRTISAVDHAVCRLMDEACPGLDEQLWALETLLSNRDFTRDIRSAYLKREGIADRRDSGADDPAMV